MQFLRKFIPVLIVFVLSYFVIKPLFMPGSFPIHDDTQVARVFEMQKALADGMFPVRWVTDLGYGYGYPIFNFYAPFGYYIGGFFNLIGVDALTSTKIMMGLSMVLAGVFMYLFARDFWGRSGGVIAALLYLYAPYHAVNLYVRGDVAELWAYACIPLTFFGLWNTYTQRQWKYVIIGSIGYAGIILSHNLTAMMVSPFLLLTALLLYIFIRQENRREKAHYPIIILFIGMLLAAFYWLPVFAEMKYTNVLSQVGGGADYKDHFVCPIQLWDSQWGFGGSTPNSCIDGMSYNVGKLHIIFAVVSLFAFGLLWKSDKRKFWLYLVFLFSLLFAVFLMFDTSRFIWDNISQMAFFQYPWRFLLITSFLISFLGGAVGWLAKKYLTSPVLFYPVIGIIGLCIIFLNFDFFEPQVYVNKTASDYTNTATLRWTTSRISDEYMPAGFREPHDANDVPKYKITPQEGVIIHNIQEKTQEITAEITAAKQTELLINHAYFPTWYLTIDGKETDFTVRNNGLTVTFPEGKHTLVLSFRQTTMEKLANSMSLTGVFILILGIIGRQKQYKKHG